VQIRRATVSQLRRGDQFNSASAGMPDIWIPVFQTRSCWSGEVEVWVERDRSILLPGDLDIWLQR
jgi:hypothetical protein